MNELYARLPLLYFASSSSLSLLFARVLYFYQWFKGNVHRIDAVFGWFCHKNQYVLYGWPIHIFFIFFPLSRSLGCVFHCFNILSNRFFIGHIRKANNVSGEWTTESDDESCTGIFLSFSFYKYIDWYIIHTIQYTTYIHIRTHTTQNGFDFFLLFCWTHNFYADLANFFFLSQCTHIYIWADRLRLMSSINTCFYVFWRVFFSFLLFKVVALNFFCLLQFLSIRLPCLNSISTLHALDDVSSNHLNNKCIQYWPSGRIDIEFLSFFLYQSVVTRRRMDVFTLPNKDNALSNVSKLNVFHSVNFAFSMICRSFMNTEFLSFWNNWNTSHKIWHGLQNVGQYDENSLLITNQKRLFLFWKIDVQMGNEHQSRWWAIVNYHLSNNTHWLAWYILFPVSQSLLVELQLSICIIFVCITMYVFLIYIFKGTQNFDIFL